MKILRKSHELTSKELYALTLSQGAQKMKDCVGQELELHSWALYQEENSKGEEQTILSILTKDGEVFATNSATFTKDFLTMVDFFKDNFNEEVVAINVISGTSKNNREFITCTHAR